jgi:hypothetical protein
MESNRNDAIETLVVYNITYMVIGYVLVSIFSNYMDFIISVLLVLLIIVCFNKIHLSKYWDKVLK